MKKIICWWIGHDPNYGNRNSVPCFRCGDQDIEYHELVWPSRYEKLKILFNEAITYPLFRRWIPKKCQDCGQRYKCDESIEHMPF